MSLINQSIYRKGLYIKSVSNRFTSNATTLNTNVAMGAGSAGSQFATYSTNRIIINEAARYRITYSIFSKGLINFTFNSYANWSLRAGSNIIGVLSGFWTGGIESNDFGISSYYTIANDTLNASSFVAGNPVMEWTGYFNKANEVNLSSGDEIEFIIQGTNLEGNGHRIGIDGHIYVEQIS